MPLTGAGGKPIHTRAEFGKLMRASWGDDGLDKVAVHNGLEADDEGRAQVIEFYYRWYLREAGRSDLADARAGVVPGFGDALETLRSELTAAALRVPMPTHRTPLQRWMFDPLANARVAAALWRAEQKRKERSPWFGTRYRRKDR